MKSMGKIKITWDEKQLEAVENIRKHPSLR